MVVAKSFARIHWQNLVNFGVLPLEFADPDDYATLKPGDILHLTDVRAALRDGRALAFAVDDRRIDVTHRLSTRQVDVVLAGGVIPLLAAQS